MVNMALVKSKATDDGECLLVYNGITVTIEIGILLWDYNLGEQMTIIKEEPVLLIRITYFFQRYRQFHSSQIYQYSSQCPG